MRKVSIELSVDVVEHLQSVANRMGISIDDFMAHRIRLPRPSFPHERKWDGLLVGWENFRERWNRIDSEDFDLDPD